MTNSDLKEFIDYVYDFYGKNGIYNMKATKSQIKEATKLRLQVCKLTSFPFEADSVDREAVRDILINKFSLTFPK